MNEWQICIMIQKISCSVCVLGDLRSVQIAMLPLAILVWKTKCQVFSFGCVCVVVDGGSAASFAIAFDWL